MVYLLNTESFDDGFMYEVREAEKKIFHTDKHQRGNRLSVCARVLLGYILKKNYGMESFSYRYGKNGKPYLENSSLYFSISHSGEYALCCVSDKEIGCDIEIIKECNFKVAKRFFTEKEAEALKNALAADAAFARLWTLKESILKRDGTGISGGLDSYCFADYVTKREFFAYGCNFLCVPFGDYMLSVCSEGRLCEPVLISEKEIEEYIKKINLKNT